MLKNRVCIITGAAGAIGSAVVEELLFKNAKVIATDINYSPTGFSGEEAKQDGNLEKRRVDVTNVRDVQALVEQVFETFKRIDVVVTCSGILRSKDFEEIKKSEWEQMIQVNLTGVFLVCQAAYRKMKEQGSGVIVNVSSDAGQTGSTMSSADYGSSKAGVLGLTKCIAREGARWGIRANAVAPGFIASEMLVKFSEFWGEEHLEEIVRESVPLKRMGLPSEVAKLISFLVSEEAAYITGATFDINGGSLMR